MDALPTRLMMEQVLKCFLNLGPRALEMLQARATLIRHWVLQYQFWYYYIQDANLDILIHRPITFMWIDIIWYYYSW